MAGAYDFEVDGICYNITGDTTVQVTFRYQEDTGLDYIGDIVIPSKVDYNGKKYTVTEIRKSAFYNCRQLTSVSIPNTVKSIGSQAFIFCTSLTDVNIPYGVTSIEKSTFFACGSLKRITIPNSVKSIDDWAFGDCIGLTRIAIPSSVTYISTNRDPFSRCSNVNNIIVESGNPVYDSRNNCNAIIETASQTLIHGCVNSVIPNSVISIGKAAFNACKGLQSISIPNSVKYIGDYAFDFCEELKEAEFGNSLLSIGDYAFNFCNELTNITIPNSVTSIGKFAFFYTSIRDLYIPSSVNTIGKRFIGACDNLTTIKVDNSNNKYDSRNNCNAIIETETNSLSAGCKNTIIPNTVTAIGDSAFCSLYSLTSIIIPNSVNTIGDAAFSGCKGLKSISIPNSVTSIGRSAFNYCDGLSSVTIPNSVLTIGRGAFAECSSLKSVIIGKSVSSIGSSIFDRCDSLEIITCLPMMPPLLEYYPFSMNMNFSGEIRVPFNAIDDYKSAPIWEYYSNLIQGFSERFHVNGIQYQWTGPNTVSVTYKDENYNSYSGIIIIPASITHEGQTYQVTEIGENAFRFCDNLTSVSIPNSVTRIGDCAFQECSQLKSITIPNSVEEIGNHAFDYAGLTNVNLGNSIKTIGGNAFTGCQFTSLILPEGLLSIGENAFSECSLMKSINLPGTLVSIGELAFDMCSSLSAITIPETVTYIGREAFEECHSLTSMKVQSGNRVYDSRNNCNAIIETATSTLIAGCKTSIIPNTVKAIGDYAFALCEGIGQVSIPSSVESIGNDAFIGCSTLSSVTIGANVTSIGEYAFLDCEEITDVTCLATIPPTLFNMDCFSDCVYDNVILYVPKGSLENYIFSENWSRFLNIQELESSNEKGDVNGDGEINIADVNAIIDIILSGKTNILGDVNNDGEVNIADVNAVIDIILR